MLEKIRNAYKPDSAPKTQVTQHEHWGVCCTSDELIALRLQARQLHFPVRRKSKVQLSGGKLSALRGRGIDFDEVRAYQPGDEIRSIDWRVTARTGQAHTKVYREEKEKPVYLLLDLRSNMFFGSSRYFKSVMACHVASLLAWSTITKGDRLGGLVFSETAAQEIKPKSGAKSVLHYIHSASQFSQQLLTNQKKSTNKPQETLNTALQKLYQIVKPGSLIYLVSDFHDFNQESLRHLNLLGRHNDLIAIGIFDPLEQNLPEIKNSGGKFTFTHTDANPKSDAIKAEITEIDGEDKNSRQAYRQHFLNIRDTIEEGFLHSGVFHCWISSAEDAFTQLERVTQGRRRRGIKT